jgi:hypothetical protein
MIEDNTYTLSRVDTHHYYNNNNATYNNMIRINYVSPTGPISVINVVALTKIKDTSTGTVYQAGQTAFTSTPGDYYSSVSKTYETVD